MNQKREYWIDWSKSFLMYLVIVGHAGVLAQYPVINNLITAFHMPAFFMIGGYLHKHVNDAPSLVGKNFRRLIIPVLFFSFISWAYQLVKFLSGIKGINSTFDSVTFDELVLKPVTGLFIYDRSIATPMFSVSWFLIMLFFLKIVANYILLLKKKHLLLIIVGCIITLFFIRDSGKQNLWFFPQRFLVCFPFYIAGFIMKEFNSWLFNKYTRLVALCLGVVFVTLSFYNGRSDIAYFLFGRNVLLYFLTAIAGSLFVFLASFSLNKSINKFIHTIATSTITILGLHLIVLEIVRTVSGIEECFVISFFTLFIIYPIALGFNQYLPICVGMERPINRMVPARVHHFSRFKK